MARRTGSKSVGRNTGRENKLAQSPTSTIVVSVVARSVRHTRGLGGSEQRLIKRNLARRLWLRIGRRRTSASLPLSVAHRVYVLHKCKETAQKKITALHTSELEPKPVRTIDSFKSLGSDKVVYKKRLINAKQLNKMAFGR